MQVSEKCRKAQLAITDTLVVVGGKWKLIVLIILKDRKMRFNELSKEAGISPRILSKELTELQLNGLVSRTVLETRPIQVEYECTPYAKTLDEVLQSMEKWGTKHAKYVRSKDFVKG